MFSRLNKFFLSLLLAIMLASCSNPKSLNSQSNDIESLITEFENSSITKVLEARNVLPIADRIKIYHHLKSVAPKPNLVKDENQLNRYGYALLWNDKPKEAFEIFKLAVDEFPMSSNAYDSYAEAHLALGNKEASLKNYRKSLDLNPYNYNAEDQIEAILNPNVKAAKKEIDINTTFTKDEYLKDFDQLVKSLLDVNPNALKFISEEEFNAVVDEKKKEFTSEMTYGEFRWHCREIIANVNCSHTSMGGFWPDNEMIPIEKRFPMQVRWTDGHLFIVDPRSNSDEVKIKDEILSINGISVEAIIEDIYKRIPTQGLVESGKKHFFNNWATGLLAFSLKFPDNYAIQVKGNSSRIFLKRAQTNKDPFWDFSVGSCGADLCLEELEDGKSAVMTITSFVYYNWFNFKTFEKFIDSSFVVLKEKNIENLIFDLRFNGGGAPEASIHLLRYLLDEPFTYYSSITGKNTSLKENLESIAEVPFEDGYKGDLYFIIDGNGESTTGHFMSIVKHFDLGVIVGEELGSNQLCTGGGINCRLKNTRITYQVADVTCISLATTLPEERGILPDHYVTQSIDDYLNDIDAVKQFTLELIGK